MHNISKKIFNYSFPLNLALLYKNLRHFTTTIILNVEDNDDLMTRINKLMQTNKDFVDKAMPDVLTKERANLDKNLADETKSMKSFLDLASTSLKDDGLNKCNSLVEQTKRLTDLTQKKIDELDPKDPSYNLEVCKLVHLQKKFYNNHLDQLEPIMHEAIKKDMDETKADFVERLFFTNARNKRLKERKLVLEAENNLQLKEIEFFNKQAQQSSIDEVTASIVNVKETQTTNKQPNKPSNIEDFADPNLDMPTYMDPED